MLHRNLSYIRDPKPKQKKKKQQVKRAEFKIDNLLENKEKVTNMKKDEDAEPAHYMNMSF